MAIGRTEMECPVELWVTEKNGTGHPDEVVLSTLQSLRNDLHQHIFRPNILYENIEELISHFLSHLTQPSSSLISKLDRCIDNFFPLVELLGGGENSAPDRLLRMLLPQSESNWICQNVQSDRMESSLTTLTLEYIVILKRGYFRKSMTISEIEEFQSSLVLAQTEARSIDTNQQIQNFLLNFSYWKSFREVIEELEVS
jgi:hypothetical protein